LLLPSVVGIESIGVDNTDSNLVVTNSPLTSDGVITIDLADDIAINTSIAIGGTIADNKLMISSDYANTKIKMETTGASTNVSIDFITKGAGQLLHNGLPIFALPSQTGNTGKSLISGGSAGSESWGYPTITGQIGAWSSRVINTSYTASTDGFVIGNIYKTYEDNTEGYATVETPVGTARMSVGAFNAEWGDTRVRAVFMCPVRKGDTWKVSVVGTYYTVEYLWWIPIGN
jgi:hypothetical protein